MKLSNWPDFYEEHKKSKGKVRRPLKVTFSKKVLVKEFKRGYRKGCKVAQALQPTSKHPAPRSNRHKFNAHKFVEGFALKRRFSYLIFIPIAIFLVMVGYAWGQLSKDPPDPGIHPPSPKTSPLKPLQAPVIDEQSEAQEESVVEPVAVSKPSTFVAGNDYDFDSCTYGVANWTAVPPGLGDAKYWGYNAASMGFRVSSTPSIGSVGVNTSGWWGHVVYILDVQGSQVYLREQNYDNAGSIRERWASASEFAQYIVF